MDLLWNWKEIDEGDRESRPRLRSFFQGKDSHFKKEKKVFHNFSRLQLFVMTTTEPIIIDFSCYNSGTPPFPPELSKKKIIKVIKEENLVRKSSFFFSQEFSWNFFRKLRKKKTRTKKKFSEVSIFFFSRIFLYFSKTNIFFFFGFRKRIHFYTNTWNTTAHSLNGQFTKLVF